MRQIIFHKCVICGKNTDCYDSDREGDKKCFCVDPFTGKDCRKICPPEQKDKGGSFCEKHKIEVLNKMREDNKKEK